MQNKLKEFREAAGLTQEQLSEKASVSRAIISGIESGRTAITTTGTLCKLATALGKPISEIFFTHCV